MTTQTVYLAYHDVDAGNREDWSVFYCTPHVGATEELAIKAAEKAVAIEAVQRGYNPLEFNIHVVGPLEVIESI